MRNIMPCLVLFGFLSYAYAGQNIQMVNFDDKNTIKKSLIGCLVSDDKSNNHGILCLLPNQRIMINAVGMTAFGSYTINDDIMTVNMDKPNVFTLASTYNPKNIKTIIKIMGDTEQVSLLTINQDLPIHLKGEQEISCTFDKVSDVSFYANMNESSYDKPQYQGYIWQYNIPNNHNDIIIRYDTNRDNFSQTLKYEIDVDKDNTYFYEIKHDNKINKKYHLLKDDKYIKFINEYFDENGKPIFSKLNDEKFILLNGFDEIDVFMTNDKTYGSNAKFFDYHENGNYYTIKHKYLDEFDSDDKGVNIYKYRMLSHQPIKTDLVTINQDKQQSLSQCKLLDVKN